jgi:hypothetical protein
MNIQTHDIRDEVAEGPIRKIPHVSARHPEQLLEIDFFCG